METVWCPDRSSIINIIPDCEAHFSLWWDSPTPHHHPPSGATQGTIFGPCSILVSNRRAFRSTQSSIYMSKPPQALDVRDPIWNDKARPGDSWSTKEGWLSSSSQSPAAPLTHSASIQQMRRREREECCHAHSRVAREKVTHHRRSIIAPLLEHISDSAPKLKSVLLEHFGPVLHVDKVLRFLAQTACNRHRFYEWLLNFCFPQIAVDKSDLTAETGSSKQIVLRLCDGALVTLLCTE